MSNSEQRSQWSGRFAFIMAATGSAVGLGNIWKFPYITGENGGGAFVLMYLVCIALVGIPILMAEIMIGRRGQKSPGECFGDIADKEKSSKAWRIVGGAGSLTAYLILTFYSVIGGWTLNYLSMAISNTFAGLPPASIENIFGEMLANPLEMLAWHSVFMVSIAVVVMRGLNKGIERAVVVLMPAMMILIVGLVLYGAFGTTGFNQSMDFLFSVDFSKITGEAFLTALGHSFFTLSLGMSVMIAYGSHLPKNISIARAAISISALDTIIALLAGLAIFAIVFDNGQDVSAGPGLIFQSLPIAFSEMNGGFIVSIAFFFLLLFAAWSSAVSLLVPPVERMESKGISLGKSTWLVAGTAWAIGILALLSFNVLGDFKLFGMGIFDLLDYLTGKLLLPLVGLMVAIFAGWVMSYNTTTKELGLNGLGYIAWRVLTRFVAPALVVVVFIYGLGIF
ncbi:NSS family neurotransmitter:Na+ symporter [Sinobacterium caligoides]|uniref:Transporter n=1 Tax=Sinobacterium caligoides TaxID=933926 RepID=A0A3N2DQB8_9GAMM|nr:sodium-dependent transporter [Sinobacterium caligoides]ROS01980.1 NSS family neurotransmitter:Na+ symporter [Sinobacterium caligoides]